jgi:hypothetical protein
MARHVEHSRPARFVKFKNNAWTHSAAQTAQIVASIVGFGFIDLALVVRNAGIVAGQKRGYRDAN